MRPEKLYLVDIVEAAAAIERFLSGISQDQFHEDELRQSAVLQKLTVIGEATARLPAEFRESRPEVEWRDIVGFRNIAVHEYFAVNWLIVWIAATQDGPKLRVQIEAILAEEFADESDGATVHDGIASRDDEVFAPKNTVG